MTPTPGKLLLLDTPSLYFRAFFGVPDTMTAPDGSPVNAVRGLLDFIARLVGDRTPTRLVAAMDADWRPAFRVDGDPVVQGAPGGHAVDEEEVPDALSPQVADHRGRARGARRRLLRRRRLRGRRRHRHARDPRPGSGRHRDRRPRPVPAGRRRARRCGCSTPPAASGRADVVDEALGGRQVRHPGSVVRRLRHPARRPQRRAARRRRGRRQDRGRADHEVRLAGGAARGAGRRRHRDAGRGAQPSWLRRATTWRSPRRSSRWQPTYRCRRTTTRSPPRRATPDRLVELSERWGLDSPLNRVLSAFTDVQPPD